MITVNRKDFKRIVREDPYELGFGIRACVEVLIPYGNDGTSIIQMIESPGLWEVDRDSEDDVYKDECKVLEHMLTAMGMKVEGSLNV